MHSRFAVLALLTAALLLVLSVFSFGQDLDHVAVSGTVTDPNGLAVVGATVTIKETTNGKELTATTNNDGRYQFLALDPGKYKLTATASGFATTETPELPMIAGKRVQQDFKLGLAGVAVETTVTADPESVLDVDTTRTVTGSTLTEREIEELPLDSRNPLDLVLTIGGTMEEPLSTRDLADDRGERGISAPGTTPEEAGIFGLSGGAAYSNNVTINGLDNNDDRGASFRFQPSIDAVGEVQVITNQFSAEYGRASGGRVNLVTRGGTNRFRGRAYYYFRDESLNANTWNNNRRHLARPPYQENNPGVTFGGPIIKNRLFFFSSYEYDNIFDTTVLDAWVPVGAGNPRFNLPAPNDPSAGTVTISGSGVPPVTVGHYLAPTDTPAIRHTFSTRLDWNASSKHTLTFGWQLGRSSDQRAFSGTNRIADSIIGRTRDTDAYNLSHSWVISPNIINQARIQFSKLDPKANQAAGALSPAVLVTFTVPTESSSSTQIFGSTTNASDRKENRWQFQDNLTIAHGPLTFRVGADYQSIDTTYIDRLDATGTYSFSNFAFYGANSISRLRQNFGGVSNLKNRYVGVFGQADWKVRPNLMLTTGLRYERETVLSDNNNFGPRVAVAWNPFPKTDTTVIRFGAGIFYNRVLLRTVDDYTSDSLTLRLDTNSFNVPAGTTITGSVWRDFLATQFPRGLSLDTMIPVNATQSFSVRDLSRPSSVFRSLDSELKIPESYQFNLGFERQVAKGLTFEVNLTYNRTVRLWRETNPNAPVLPGGLTDVNGDGQVTFTDYLLGVQTGPNRFFDGPYGDGSPLLPNGSGAGTHVSPNASSANCSSSTPVCWVNVNTVSNNSSTSCSTTTTTNTPVCRAFAAINSLRPYYSTLGSVQLERVGSIGSSRYVGAVFELRSRYKRYKNGWAGAFRLSYALSRLMDDGIVNTSDPTMPGDFSREWSRSLSDRTHRITLTGTIDLPKWLGKLRFSPVLRYGSSSPFNVSAGGVDRNLDDISNDRPSFAGNLGDIQWRKYGSQFPTELGSQFAYAPIGSPGNLPRNAGNGPSLIQFNFNVTREFRFGERFKLRPSLEVINPLNMTVFSFGSNFINLENLTTQGGQDSFLAPTRTMTPRRIRLGLRFDF